MSAPLITDDEGLPEMIADLRRRYGQDVAAEALFRTWKKFLGIKRAYAYTVARKLADANYHDGLSRRSRTCWRERVTSDGECSGDHAMWQQSASPEHCLLDQEEARRQHHAIAQCPAWLRELYGVPRPPPSAAHPSGASGAERIIPDWNPYPRRPLATGRPKGSRSRWTPNTG
jgi:hypothetical protein